MLKWLIKDVKKKNLTVINNIKDNYQCRVYLMIIVGSEFNNKVLFWSRKNYQKVNKNIRKQINFNNLLKIQKC